MEDKTVSIPATLTVNDFAKVLDVKVTAVITELMKNGVMATINDPIDYETAAIIGSDLGFDVTLQAEKTKADTKLGAGEGEPRPPVVAVMGHVDHGKTSLLDAIRESDVAAGEAGGITQHVSAYQITYNKRLITFLDTPGHEAFAILREHGARLTDVAIIVVAADDGIKPQTVEAIEFAKKAGVRIVVALNKIDKPDADITRAKQQLSEIGLMPEDWGGDTVVVEVSAKAKQNLDKLLDMVLLVADIEDLRARATGSAEGMIIESRMVTGRGPVATVLVEQGVLKVGDFVVAGKTYGRVRNLEDTTDKPIKQAGPSTPVVIAGWKEAPQLGSRVEAVDNEKLARQMSTQGPRSFSADQVKTITHEEKLTAAMAASGVQTLFLVVKADVQGSLDSLVQSLQKLGNEEVKVKVVSSGIGPVSESDVASAESAGAAVVGFNVTMPVRIKQLALRGGVVVKLYTIIYELLDDVSEGLQGLLAPEIVEETIGKLEVKGIFKVMRNSIICGGLVTEGKLTADLLVRFGEEEIGRVKSVQREQQATKEVVEGELCGLEIVTEQKTVLSEGDKLEFFTRSTKARTL